MSKIRKGNTINGFEYVSYSKYMNTKLGKGFENFSVTQDEFVDARNNDEHRYNQLYDIISQEALDIIIKENKELINNDSYLFNIIRPRTEILPKNSILKPISIGSVHNYHLSISNRFGTSDYEVNINASTPLMITANKIKDNGEYNEIEASGITTNNHTAQDIGIFVSLPKDFISVNVINKKLKTIDKEIVKLEEKLKDFHNKRDQLNWIEGFMKKLKVSSENINTLKSKMILKTIEDSKDEKDEALVQTNINDILEIKL